MNFVEPIRSQKKITQIKNIFRGQSRYRDLLMFVFGINSALRISDLLELQVKDLFDVNNRVRSRFWIKEQKRGKRQEIIVNASIRGAIQEYINAHPGILDDPEHSLFFNTKFLDYRRPIKRGQAWKIISTICQEAGLNGNYGTHTLRKTWGYHARMQGVDLALIMHKLNHESLVYTKRYLGITDEEIGDVIRKLNL